MASNKARRIAYIDKSSIKDCVCVFVRKDVAEFLYPRMSHTGGDTDTHCAFSTGKKTSSSAMTFLADTERKAKEHDFEE